MKARLVTCYRAALACWLALASAVCVAGSLEEDVKALEQEFEKAREEYSKSSIAAKTDAERQQADARCPTRETYAARFLELARKDPKSTAGFRALGWIMVEAMGGGAYDEAVQMLVLNHLANPKLGGLLFMIEYSPSKSAEMLLREALAKSPHRVVQAHACLQLARYLRNHKRETEAEKFFERTITDYAGVFIWSRRTSLGEIARWELEGMRKQRIGAVAPEIEGQDVNGKPMKLSEFRGKVVVLDFWGGA